VLSFAVVIARAGRQVPERVLDRIRDRNGTDLPFAARRHLVWSNAAQTVWFAGWQETSSDSVAAHHWHVDDDGLTAFAGQLWPRREGWRGTAPWATELAGRLRSTPLAAPGDDLAGIFVAASLSARGRSVVASDPLGVGLNYWGEGRDFVVISTRAALAARLLGAEHPDGSRRDAFGVGWLAYGDLHVGLRTGFARVSVVPEDAHVEIDPATGPRLVSRSRSAWRPTPSSAAPEATLEDALGEMAIAVRMGFALPGAARTADLTGGKDSRLVLALLVANGSASEVEFGTLGADDLPDVVVAREIARALGLHHVSNPGRAVSWEWRKAVHAAVRDRGLPEASDREIGFRMTAWAGSGVKNVVEPLLGRLQPSDTVLFSGLFGETLRTNHRAFTDVRSKGQLARRFPRLLRLGGAGIVRPEIQTEYRREIHRLLFEQCLETDCPPDVVDAYYIRNRLRRWFGTEQELDLQRRVFPLYSITAVRLAFTIGAQNRHREWMHYHLMKEACAPLVDMPFAGGGWPDGASAPPEPTTECSGAAPSAPPRLTLPSVLSLKGRGLRRRTPKRTVSGDHLADREAVDLAIMRRFLQEDPSNPVFEIIDPVATRQALDRYPSLVQAHKRQLFGALTAAIWLGGHEIELPPFLSSRGQST
jgi:hypothetical protein